MGAGAAAGLLLVTLLLRLGTGAEQHCGQGTYLHEGLCCISCPAGTYVAEHCSAPHSRGRCVPCIEGETYTGHENGLEGCLPCRQCKDDQVTLRSCTLMRDTECQCREGYFCPAEGCEICQRCSTMCPEGKEIVHNCNATMDLGCGSPDQGGTALVWVIVIVLVVGGLLLFFVIRKLKSKKDASNYKDPEEGLGSTKGLISPEVETPTTNSETPEDENSGESPEDQEQTNVNSEGEDKLPEENSFVSPGSFQLVLSEWGTILRKVSRRYKRRGCRRTAESSLLAKLGQNPAARQKARSGARSRGMLGNRRVRDRRYRIIVKDLSQKELRYSFWTFIKEVPPRKWRQLMRTHLLENDLAKIIQDFPNDTEEQSYQMLLTWKNTLGEKQSIIKLLDELQSLDTKAYDNVLNTLKSSNIISKLEATD